MRWSEIAAGIRVPISGEETILVDRIRQEPVSKQALTDREQQLARQLVSRGVLDYFKRDNQTYFRVSTDQDIWRDRDAF